METIPIPGPPGLPLLGNIADIDTKDLVMSISKLADTYGEIFRIHVAGITRIVVSSQALMDELCDEKRFAKMVGGGIRALRTAVNDGLFTGYMEEHNWQIAHRTLVPAFGPLSVAGMFDEMHDIASQLVAKWARFGPGARIDVNADFTRLTLDTIALCAMDKRFNSFYREDMHPFVDVMMDALREAQMRGTLPSIINSFRRSAEKKFYEDIAYLRNICEEMIVHRKKNPSNKKDLLNAMIHGKDPKTGCSMTDQSIIDNMITFLVAGHETTSSLLAFVFYLLIKNPDAMKLARKEVDDVVGTGPITSQHLNKLPYIEAALKETLRLYPTAPAIAFTPDPDTTEWPIFLAGGKYKLEKGETLLALLVKIHVDPKAYGDDAEEWKPERMFEENFATLPPNSWKPFGNGQRGCIGRPFAMQEAILATAILLQNFDFSFDDPNYELQIQQALSIKPKNFYMRASLREKLDATAIERKLYSNVATPEKTGKLTIDPNLITNGKNKDPLTILYGSNSGTCEALAQSLATVAGSHGYEVRVNTLDSATGKVPKDQPLLIICPSYEGQPPDNASQFSAWLEGLKNKDSLSGVQFAIFGVGNRDWTSTFHKVPLNLDKLFVANGATRMADLGLGDVGRGDIFNDFDNWQDNVLWPAIQGEGANAKETCADIDLDISTSARSETLRQDLQEAVVLSNTVLTAAGQPEKRHVELRIPNGMEYTTGEYLAILPTNSQQSIRRVLKRFALPSDAVITIKGANAGSTLPDAHPISVMDLLGSYVELNQTATKRNIQRLAAVTTDTSICDELLALAGPNFDTSIKATRRSLLSILETHPSIQLPFSTYLSMLPPMRIRQYSISSSPRSNPTTASITFSVLSVRDFQGVASAYLSGLERGDVVHVAVKPTILFTLPEDVERTPVIMVGAGSGIAPFRGFLQEHEQLAKSKVKLAPAYLFIGCRDPDLDRLFHEEIDQWEKSGIVKVFYAYSRAEKQSTGCRYVQDRVWAERKVIGKLIKGNAKMLVCGSSVIGDGVKEVVRRIYGEESGKGVKEVEKWFEGLKGEGRWALDAFD